MDDSFGVSVELLDDTDALQGLTAKQYRLAVLSFSGMNDTEAYRVAYEPGDVKADTLGQRAHHAMRHPKVQAKLLELRLKSDQQTTLAPYLTRDFVLNGVMTLALSASKESVRLAAYQTLGKTVGIDLFRDTVVTEKRVRTVDDVDRELREHLARLAPMIEGEARTVTPAKVDAVSEGVRRGDRRRKPAR